MKILVTGGMGFIGSNFIRMMLGKYDCTIINYDALTYAGNPDNLKDIKTERYSFYKGRVEELSKLLEASKGVDAIVHFAAETHVDRSIENAAPFITTNVIGTYCVLEAARINRIEKLVHISTDEVYGSASDGIYFSEDSPLNPSSPYAASKASADLIVRSYFNIYRIPVCIVRPCNNYGPFQYPEKFIPLSITNLLEDVPVPLYGDGRNIRDWIYVEDCCDAIYVILKSGKPGEVYNIASSNELRNIDVVKKIISILGKDEGLIKFVKDRPAHDYRYALNCEKIRLLGWSPQMSFDDGLRKTVDWYVSNRDWWKNLKDRMKREKGGYWG